MDLHLYRTPPDKWHDLRAAARKQGAVLSLNAFTLDELVRRLTPGTKSASVGQRAFLIERAARRAGAASIPGVARYAADAISELKAAGVAAAQVAAGGADLLAKILEAYDGLLGEARLADPQDRRWLAARAADCPWVRQFDRVVLHALYDLTNAEFGLVSRLIEILPEGGTVLLFNATANVKATQFAEWTWQRFVQDERLADRTFPEFCRSWKPILERLFVFEPKEPLERDGSLKIVEAPGRYKEVEAVGGEIAELIASERPEDIAIVVRHVEYYGEMIEDVFSRYRIPHAFATGVPLVRVPCIKYWLALLDLVTGDRRRDALARIMASAYYEPRLSPETDVEGILTKIGYIDRNHLRASELARRRQSSLEGELERLEQSLDALEASSDTVRGFLGRLPPPASITERDRQAWNSLVEELQEVDRIAGVLPFHEFRKIASEIAGLRTVDRLSGSAIPPGLPRVSIMGPQGLGYREFRWIFALGMADGEFPARSAPNPLLPDATIELVNRQSKPHKLMASRERGRREPLYLFNILDSGRERVTLTYSGINLEGEPVYPSIYIHEILRHYREQPFERVGRDLQVFETGEYLRKVADEWRRGTLSDEQARAVLGEDVVRRVAFERRGVRRADIGEGVLAVDTAWTPSELDTLAGCPFVFLARHRLKLERFEEPDYDIPTSELGVLAHRILRDFYSEPLPESIELARARMDKIVERHFSLIDVDGQGPRSVFDPALWKIRREQLVAALAEYVTFALEDAQAGFETVAEFLDKPLPEACLGKTRLAGRPDRIAVRRSGERIEGLRVDDFKYSAASEDYARLIKRSFQLPVYAYLAEKALGVDEGMPAEGRYLLMRSPRDPVVSVAIDRDTIRATEVLIESVLEKVRRGALHPDPVDRRDCVECQYRRLCRLYAT